MGILFLPSYFNLREQIANIRTMKPSARVPYVPSRGPLRTKFFSPTTYTQAQEQRRRILQQPKQANRPMDDEKELARALALLALPNR